MEKKGELLYGGIPCLEPHSSARVFLIVCTIVVRARWYFYIEVAVSAIPSMHGGFQRTGGNTMKYRAVILVALLFSVLYGCSGLRTVECEGLTSPEARKEYVLANPNCQYNQYIDKGEIIRGMNIYEVIASWGLPNKHVYSPRSKEECWIYYVAEKEHRYYVTYSLYFDDIVLSDWNIDINRTNDFRIVYEPLDPDQMPIRKSSLSK